MDRVHRSREGRLLYPMLRAARDQPLKRVSWDAALDYIAERLQAIRTQHGDSAVAFYGSGQLDTEASYMYTKLFKGYLRSNNTDSNSRLCMSSAVAAYNEAFGADAPPGCYADIEQAELFLITGANMAVNHPILWERIRERRKHSAKCRIIVVDPRQTQTAQGADFHIPLAPGTDIQFLCLVARELLDRKFYDMGFVRANSEGFEAWRSFLENLDREALLRQCDIHAGRIAELVEWMGETQKFMSFYCQGLNQSSSGTDKNLALINLHLLRGAIGIPGAGPFSLTGQPNAMGGREVGYLAHQLPGYRMIANPEHRSEMEQLWQVPAGTIRPQPGLSAVPLFAAAQSGEVRAMWIAATNPVASMPDAHQVRASLAALELVVVQDAYHPTETTQYADVLLPAAQWGEKSGTMTNSERLVARSTAMLPPPGEARPDWEIIAAVARRMGFTGFDFATHEQVWDEVRLMTRGRPCDQWGITNERLKRGPMQWPCGGMLSRGTARRYTNGKFHTVSGRARFVVTPPRDPAELCGAEYPLVLTTGRLANHWHTRTRTGRIAELAQQEPLPFITMHPQDAEQLHLAEGERVRLHSARGMAVSKVRLSAAQRRGLVFSSFHWADLYHRESNINNTTSAALDPKSKQPELKYAAVRVEKWSQ